MAIGAVLTGVGAAAGGLGKLIGAFGDDKEISGFELPPELEIQFLDEAQAQFEQSQQDLDRIAQLEQEFVSRLDTLEGLIQGTIPSVEGLQSLRDSALRISQNIGASAEELVSQGFLDQDDIKDIQQLEELEREDFRDPELENQITRERQRLQQDLIRAGASGASIQQRLTKFDQDADETRFRRTEELRTGRFARISGRVGLRAGLRQQGFQRAGATVGLLQEQLGFARQGVSQLGEFAGARFGAGQAGIQARAGLRGERRGIFETLGKFQFSGRTQELLRGGFTGPGSVEQQISGRPGAQFGQGGQRRFGGDQVLAGRRGQFRRQSNEELLRSLQQATRRGERAVGGATGQEDLRNLFEEVQRRGIA